MAITIDLLERKKNGFMLWGPADFNEPPVLVIGQLQAGNPPTLGNQKRITLRPAAGAAGLWEIAAASCGLVDAQVYHYWFEVTDTQPDRDGRRMLCTDPTATTVDWRLMSPAMSPPYVEDDRQPASVIKFKQGNLVPCDGGGAEINFAGEPSSDSLPTNNQMIIYEMPTAWSRSTGSGSSERGVGTFRDVTALIDEASAGANFSDLAVTQPGRSYLTELGVNALELLPPADSFYKREWGYDTSHYLAPDYELGFPEGNSWPTPNTDLAKLVLACHQNGIRFFIDAVMAFGRNEPYQHIDFSDFYIGDPAHHRDDPDAMTSIRGYGGQTVRCGFGSTLFRYAKLVNSYDPISGQVADVYPARALMYAYLARWMRDFHVDGVRMDSIENVANWDFVGGFKDLARQLWKDRWNAAQLGNGADARFLVVGEELSLPMGLLSQGRLDGLWNDAFRELVRAAVLGHNADPVGEPSFEWTVRKMIDCRVLGFSDGTQAVNYITSHDVEGVRRERLYNFLLNNGVTDIEKRAKLAFACLLTAVGIPMILAGDEFIDQHDLFDQNGNVTQSGGKQVDPVNYSRATEPMRARVLAYVSRLVKLRATHDALSVNDTEFIHIDFNDGKRVMGWRRGSANNPVVVVANFSDWGSDTRNPDAEYVVHNWPIVVGRQWKEASQDRLVPNEWIGREPLFPWEAKVYVLV